MNCVSFVVAGWKDEYLAEIRKAIYTTNSIENYNRQLCKVTKTRTVFLTGDALFKLLYLAMMDITKKDWKSLELGADVESVLHLFWEPYPAGGSVDHGSSAMI